MGGIDGVGDTDGVRGLQIGGHEWVQMGGVQRIGGSDEGYKWRYRWVGDTYRVGVQMGRGYKWGRGSDGGRVSDGVGGYRWGVV